MANKFTRRRTIAILVLALAAGAISGAVALRLAAKDAAKSQTAKEAVTLEFTPEDLTAVQHKPLARRLSISGTLHPVRQATVKAKVSGDVRIVPVREGEKVAAGQLLARIDGTDLEAKLVERSGALESARAQLALAEKNRATSRTLLEQNFISRNAFDNSESALSVALGNVKSAEAQVQLARNALSDAVVTSPLAGIVAKRHAQMGEKVAFDSPLVTVVDLSEMELQATVPASDVPEIAAGMPVLLAIDGFGERRFAGRVERINPATEAGTRSILVYVGIPNPSGGLRGGMFATGHIALAEGTAVATLPQSAIRLEAGQTFVWTIDGGKLTRRMVIVGRRDDEAGIAEVKTPLSADLPILASRFDNLKDGARAIVRAPAASPARTG